MPHAESEKKQERGLLCTAPNQHARQAGLEAGANSVTVHGYQEFTLAKDWITASPRDAGLQRKVELLSSFFTPRYLKNRELLDLGSNAGFYCFWALQQKAEKVTAVDIDEEYLRIVGGAKERLGFGNLEIARANIVEWHEAADVVVALALVHWIYSCTALLGSLEAVIGKLAALTKYMLLMEWVEPEDEAIRFFGHLDWNRESVGRPYDREAFDRALALHFPRVEVIGAVTPTRTLYAAFQAQREIDLSGPLPLLMPQTRLVSSRLLANEGSIEYWSMVYAEGDRVHKQATLDLAEREAAFLREVASDYFPAVVDSWSAEGYSVVELERIAGEPLERVAGRIRENSAWMYRFIADCLSILAELRDKGVVHRDIRGDNILVRNEKPVLLDFGWAVSAQRPYLTPKFLGSSERPPDGSFCDTYSMGMVLREVNAGRYDEFTAVIELMTAAEADLRVTEETVLRVLFKSAYARIARRG